MKARAVEMESKDNVNNFEHTIKNILSAAYALKKVPGFTKAYEGICGGSKPESWTPNDAVRIMRCYQLIFNTLRDSATAYNVPAWKIPGYARCAEWFYENMTDHRYVSVDYYFAACAIYLHHPVKKLTNTKLSDIQSDKYLPRYAQSASKAAEITRKIEEALFHPTIDEDNIHQHLKQLALHYCDISLIYQAVADYPNALYYAEAATRTFNAIPTQDDTTIKALAELHRDLRITFSFDEFYRNAFGLLEDFFVGRAEANFARVAQLNFSCQHQPGAYNQYELIFAQCLYMIDRYASAAPLPNSTLKKQFVSDYFYQQIADLLRAYNLEPLQTSFEQSQTPQPTEGLKIEVTQREDGVLEVVQLEDEIEEVKVEELEIEAPLPLTLARQPTFFTHYTPLPAEATDVKLENDASEESEDYFIPEQYRSPSPTSQ